MLNVKHYKVNEVFRSIQGEGYWSGSAAVFIRFSGCNLDCEMCDTDHSNGDFFSAMDLTREAQNNSLSGDKLVLTGGEPLLQVDNDLLVQLRNYFNFIAIETNGTQCIPKFKRSPGTRLWVTVSPKNPATWDKLPAIDIADEIKVVVPGLWDREQLYDMASKIVLKRLFVQPQDGKEGATEWAIDLVMKDPRWRLSLQSHKILGLQ